MREQILRGKQQEFWDILEKNIAGRRREGNHGATDKAIVTIVDAGREVYQSSLYYSIFVHT